MAKLTNNTNTPPTSKTATPPPATTSGYNPSDYAELVKNTQQFKLELREIGVLSKAIELKLFDPKSTKDVALFVSELNKVKGVADRVPRALENLFPKNTGITDVRKQYDLLINSTDHAVKSIQSSSSAWLSIDTQIKKINSTQQKTNNLTVNYTSSLGDAVDIAGQINDHLQTIQSKLKKNVGIAAEFNDVTKMTADKTQQLYDHLEKSKIKNVFSDALSVDINQVKTAFDLISQNLGAQTFNIGGVELDYDKAVAQSGKMFNQFQGQYDEYFKNAYSKLNELNPQVATDQIEKLVETLKGGDLSKVDSNVWSGLSDESRVLALQIAQAKDEYDQMVRKGITLTKALSNITSKWRNAMRGVESASIEVISELERGARQVLPNWLYNVLKLDQTFSDLTSAVQKGLQAATIELGNTGKKIQALKKFGDEFGLSMKSSLSYIGMMVNPFTITAGIFAGLIASAISYYKNIKNISTELGVSKAQAIELDLVSKRLVATSKNHLVTQEGVQGILKSHLATYGTLANISSKQFQDSVEQASELSNKFGTTAESMYELQEQLGRVGLNESAVKGMLKFMGEASEMSNIPFGEISKDLRENSAFVSKQFVNMPNEIGKSIVKIKKMGGSLKDVEQIFDNMLDISGFTTDMTELFIMSSGAADLTKAMEMRFTPGTDPADVLKEVITQYDALIASGDANPFALAKMEKLTGKTADELARMSQINKMMFDTEEDRQLMAKHGGKLTKEQLKDREEALRLAKEMEKMDQLSNQMDELKAKIMLALLPTIQKMVAYLSSDTGREMIDKLGNGIAMVATAAGDLLGFFFKIGDSIGGWTGLLTSALAVWGALKLVSLAFGYIIKKITGSSDSSQDLAEKIKGTNTEIDITKQLTDDVNEKLATSVQTTTELTSAADATNTKMQGLANSVQAVDQELTNALSTAQKLASIEYKTPPSGGGTSGSPLESPGTDVLADAASTMLEGTPLEGLPIEDLMDAGQSVFAGTDSKTDAAEPKKRRKTKRRNRKPAGTDTSGSDDSGTRSSGTRRRKTRSRGGRKRKTGATLGINSANLGFGSILGAFSGGGDASVGSPKDIISGQIGNYAGELAGDFVGQFTDNPALQQVGETVGEMITDKLTDRLMSRGGMQAAMKVLSKGGPIAAAAAGFAALGTQAYQQIGSEALNAGSIWQDMGNFVAGTGSKFFGGLEYMLGTGVSEALGTAYKGLRSDQMENFRGAYRAMTGEQIGFSDEANEKLINWVKANEALLKNDRGTKGAFEALQKKLDSGEIKVTSTDVTKNENWDKNIAKEKAAEEERKQKQATVKQVGYMNQPGYVPSQVKQQGYLTAETLTPQQLKARQFTADIRKKQLELANIPAPKTPPANYAGQDSEAEMKQIRKQPVQLNAPNITTPKTGLAQYPGAATTMEMQQVKTAGTVLSDAQAAATATQINAGGGKADPNIVRLADSIANNANRPLEVQVQIGDVELRRVATQMRQYNNK